MVLLCREKTRALLLSILFFITFTTPKSQNLLGISPHTFTKHLFQYVQVISTVKFSSDWWTTKRCVGMATYRGKGLEEKTAFFSYMSTMSRHVVRCWGGNGWVPHQSCSPVIGLLISRSRQLLIINFNYMTNQQKKIPERVFIGAFWSN